MKNRSNPGQFSRVSEHDRPKIKKLINGTPFEALAGDTVLTALMLAGRSLRKFEFGLGSRGGFCLMGACQDCWVKMENGGSLRACTSYVEEGLSLITNVEES